MNRYQVTVKAIDARRADAKAFETDAETSAFDKTEARSKVFDAMADNGYRVISLSPALFLSEV